MYSKYSGYVLFIQYLVKLSDVALTLQLDHVTHAADVRETGQCNILLPPLCFGAVLNLDFTLFFCFQLK